MRILNVAQTYFPFLAEGGRPVKVRALSQKLVQRGHQVTVLTADLGIREHLASGLKAEPCRWGWRSLREGIEVIYLPTLGRYRALTVNPRVLGFCRASLGAFDLAHFYGLYDLLGPAVAFCCRRQGLPYVIEPMGMFRPIDRSLRLKLLWHRSVGAAFWRGASRVIATSEMERQELLDDGVPREKLVMRYNGIDPEAYTNLPPRGSFRAKWRISPEEPLILFLSRLIPRKGADMLIEAFSSVCAQTGRLAIAGPEGEPGYRAYLEKCAKQCGVEARVIFTGPLYDQDKRAALVDSDLFVLPSRYENFANSAAEAMACGIPVIITDSCGIQSLVNGQAGLVIAPEREALAEALRRLLYDKALYSRLKEGCQHASGQLTWDRLADRMEGYYAEALAGSHAD